MDAAAMAQRRRDYLATLATPSDGMWEGAVIARAACRDIADVTD